MPKLNQIIAISNGKKSHAQGELTKVHHMLQKTALLEGIARTYRPLDEAGEQKPEEKKNVQFTVADGIRSAVEVLTEMFDAVATQDKSNTAATADVKVDGATILKDVPVTTLLFLEKQLVDLHTFIDKFPTLDSAENWQFDPAINCYRSEPSETASSKKVLRNHVLYDATKEHPAQVNAYSEDVTVGRWSTTKFSGAIPAKSKHEMLARLRQLQDAVKFAREEANNADAIPVALAKPVFKFVFGEQV